MNVLKCKKRSWLSCQVVNSHRTTKGIRVFTCSIFPKLEIQIWISNFIITGLWDFSIRCPSRGFSSDQGKEVSSRGWISQWQNSIGTEFSSYLDSNMSQISNGMFCQPANRTLSWQRRVSIHIKPWLFSAAYLTFRDFPREILSPCISLICVTRQKPLPFY